MKIGRFMALLYIASTSSLHAQSVGTLCEIPDSTAAAEQLLSKELPEGCNYFYSKPQAVYNSGSNYSAAYKSVRKRPVVCLGETLIIDKPIRTNGGDVVIYADTLSIRDQIDTRIYTNKHLNEKFQNKITSPKFINTSEANICPRTQYIEPLLDSHTSYYADCVDCIKVDTTNVLIPRMPDGLIPAADSAGFFNGPGDYHDELRPQGTPAPVVSSSDLEMLQSGSIKLFARVVDLSKFESTNLTSAAASACPAAFPDNKTTYAINVSGLYGGKGGPGAPTRCVTGVPSTGGFICVMRIDGPTGYNGPPGNGGNAGNISVTFLGASEDDIESLSRPIIESANIAGGEVQSSDAFYSPRTNYSGAAPGTYEINDAATGSICDFYKPTRKATVHNPGIRGNVGNVVFSTMPLDEAFKKFLLEAIRLDQINNTDFKYFDSESELRSIVNGISFREHLLVELAKIIKKSQGKIANSALDWALNKNANGASLLPPAFGISASEYASFSIDTRLRSVLLDLSKYSGSGSFPLYDFLISTGGFLNVGSPSVHQRYIAENTIQEFNRIQSTLTNINENLLNIDRRYFELTASDELSEYKEKLNDLNAQIANLVELLKKSEVNYFVEAGEKVANSIAAAVKDYGTQNYVGMAKNIGAAVSNFSAIADGLYSPISQQLKDLSVLRQLSYETTNALSEVVLRIERSRDSYINKRLSVLEDKTKNRIRNARIETAKFSQFEDLLKSVLIGYFTDPARSESDLVLNISGIKDVVSPQAQDQVPFFRLRDIERETCVVSTNYTGVDRCRRVTESGENNQKLEFCGRPSDEWPCVPAYVIATGNRVHSFPTYGLLTYLRNIDFPTHLPREVE